MELEEAADIDGCSRAGTFFRIVLSLLQPVFVTMLILNGLWIWNDYLLPLLILWIQWNDPYHPAGCTGL